MPPTTDAIRRAQQCARFFRDCGWNALPSRMDRKGPALATYADYWDSPTPDFVIDDIWQTTNIQVMCGTRWGLVVVDCDGEEAHTVFRQMKEHNGTVGPFPTWVSRTGGGGWHYWFTLPAWLDECPSRRVWGVWDTWAGARHQGDWQSHKEVRILGDRSLVIAPPSVHVKTGKGYAWIPGRSPDDYARPAQAPAWVLELPAVANPTARDEVPAFAAHRAPVEAPRRPSGGFWTRDEILAAIPDKLALARQWGLKTANERPNAKGWVSCYAIDREDRNPSASFHPESGVYSEMREGVSLSLFDLAVELGRYVDWQTAKDDLAAHYLGSRA